MGTNICFFCQQLYVLFTIFFGFLKHMMTSSNGNIFRVTGPLCGEIHRSPVNFPHRVQWRGAVMFSLICAWINAWVNNRKAGDSRRHRPHYDVIVMAWKNLLVEYSNKMFWFNLSLIMCNIWIVEQWYLLIYITSLIFLLHCRFQCSSKLMEPKGWIWHLK